MEIRVPKTVLSLELLINNERDQDEVLTVGMLCEDVLVLFEDMPDLAVPHELLGDDELVRDEKKSSQAADL